jgi:ketosteroid isomerase-like protein
MATQHPNVSRFIRGARAFNENDLQTVRELFRSDLVYRVSGRGAISGEYHGIEQYGALLERVKALSRGTITLQPEVVLADDQTVMVYAHITAERNGKRLDGHNVYVFRFDGAGKCYEGRTIPVEQYPFDEFWA